MSVKLCSGDIESYKKIFRECFPSDAVFADFYFERVHTDTQAVVAECDGQAVSYMAMLPFDADILGTRKKCVYFYAVSTLEKYRGRGFMNEMMQFAFEKTAYCDFQILIPAVEGLYERYGFESFTQKKEIQLDGGNKSMYPCRDIVHLNSIYDKFRKSYDVSVARNNKWWSIIIDSAISEGFDILANDGAYAFVKEGFVAEFAYADDFYKNNTDITGRLHLPVSMARGIKTKNNYLALMLD